jgi:hypothetical protein
MKLKKISSDRLDQIEAASGGSIAFKRIDGNVLSIMFQGPLGPVFVEVGSYTVTVNELVTKKIFKLGFFKEVADEKVFIEKEFKDEHERESYISQYLFDTNRDELSIEDLEVQDI